MVSNREGRRQIPYQQYSDRSKRAFRAELASAIENLVHSMSHDDSDIPVILSDLTESDKWKNMCAKDKVVPAASENNAFLKKLAEEYSVCKDKEKNKEIRERGSKLTEKIKIGDTLKDSKISLDGSSSSGQSRVEAAGSVGRVRIYGDEKRRLLSIVACDYPYRVLKQYFKCGNGAIVAARVHCILFGRGGVPHEKLKYSRQVISKEIIDGLFDFLNRDEISRPSSCRSVIVDDKETGVRYWQDSVKNIVQQYLLEFPNGVKRTYIYTHLPKNFRMNSMLAGLCNICYDDGHTNFEKLASLVSNIAKELRNEEALPVLLKSLEAHQKYLKTGFAKQVCVFIFGKYFCFNFKV